MLVGDDPGLMAALNVTDRFVGPEVPDLVIGDGPRTLVYLPGLTLQPGVPVGQERKMATSGWEPLLDRYTVHRLSRRVRPVGTTFADMADDATAAITELGGPVDLMGASTGGMLAIHVAAARPDLVRRLVLVITGVESSAYGRRMSDTIQAAVRAGRWRRMYASILPIGGRSRLGRIVWGMAGWLIGPHLIGVPREPTMILAELSAWDASDARPLLPSVTCPTLVIGGAHDPVFPPEAVKAMASALPDAQLVIVPNVAHDFPRGAMAEHVSPFLG